nr:hypothetical protein [uncultured Pantoea sp.]
MKTIFGKVIPANGLPIDKTVLASSGKSGVQLLDCGEEFQGRYEVVSQGVLVACTDSYAKAGDFYFKESARVSAESQASYNAKVREAESAGLSRYRVRDYANDRITLKDALAQQNTPLGIPAEFLPAHNPM